MTKFLDPSFQSRPASQKYRDNWDATFKKKRPRPSQCPCECPAYDETCGNPIDTGAACEWRKLYCERPGRP